MTSNRLLALIGDGVAVCDGAMGTMLYARGVFVNRSFDELNLSQPDLVRDVHREYIAAGADIIETNTFTANRFRLAAHGCEDLVTQINTEAVRLAREASDEAEAQVWVAGSVGPLGVRIEPWGPVAIDEAYAAFKEQAEALMAGRGVDLVILETFYHLPELEQAVRAVRAVAPDVPIVAQLTVTEDGNTPEGVPPESFAETVGSWDVDAIGVNCGVGPSATLEALEEMRGVVDLPLSAQPNAGQPRNVGGRNMYLTSPEYMASYARRFVKAGVRLVGGCCGTTPEHVHAMKEAVVAARPSARPRGERPQPTESGRIAIVPTAKKSQLAQRLSEKQFPVCVQVRSPQGCDPAPRLKEIRRLQEGGVNLISIGGGRTGARMSHLAFATIGQRDLGVEAVAEFACRHRTLIGMQSEVLGAYALGLKNLVLVTGPPATFGDYPDATAALEVDSIGLTNMVRRLNQGLDIGGRPIGQATAIHIGVHVDPFAIDMDHELRRFAWKVDAGAEFAITPPVLDVEALAAFVAKIEAHRIPILASVPLLLGFRAAERLRRETGAGEATRDDLDRLLRAEKEGREAEVGLEIAIRTATALRGLVDGIQMVVPRSRYPDALKVADALKR